MPPYAGGNGESTLHDHPVSGYLYAYDPDGVEQVTVSQVSGPSDGSVSVNSDGSFTYTPNQGYVGQDSFTFEASDQNGTSDIATETIDVTNQAPYAGGNGESTLHDHPVSGYLYVYDTDGDAVTVSQVSGPSDGTVTVNSDGSFTYTPNQGFVGQDSFTFKANDGITDSTTATETIDVTNQAPYAGGNGESTLHDHPVSGYLYVYDTDGDAVTVSQVSGPSDGTVTVNSDGSFTYTPNQGFVGQDSFTFKANDGITDSTTATETIDVTNQAPYAGGNGESTLHDHPVSGYLYVYDTDGDAVTVSQVSGPSDGTVTVNSDGSFTYTPNQGFVGQDSFTFKANDGITDSTTATETIDVTDNAPVAGEVDASVFSTPSEPGSVVINLLSAAYDPDGDPVTLVSTGSPQDGTLSSPVNGVVTYTPNSNMPFVGTDTFSYTVTDGILVAMAEVKVEVANISVTFSLNDTGQIVPAPENSAFQADLTTSGVNQLGELAMGAGRPLDPNLKDAAYTNALLVVGTIKPGGTTTTDNGVTFSWNRTVSARGWQINQVLDQNGDPYWSVTQQYQLGLQAPAPDHSSNDFDDVTPSATTGNVYSYDDPCANMNQYAGVLLNSYMAEERTFTYTLTATVNGVSKVVGSTQVGQLIQAKRTSLVGATIAAQWTGMQNTARIGKYTQILTAADVRTLVGGTVPINITNANPPAQ